MTDKKASQDNLKNKSPQNQYQEEISAELLAERALAETIREGGAFARKNDES
nr:hypothetical protein [Fredinandcohnia onubensis]